MADKYEKFLTGHMSARRLCQVDGFEDCANHLVPVLWGLQNAHDKAVYREAARLLQGIVRGLREGKISRGKAHELFGLNAKALGELVGILEGTKPHRLQAPRATATTRRNKLADEF
jgi:hypothetical protein